MDGCWLGAMEGCGLVEGRWLGRAIGTSLGIDEGLSVLGRLVCFLFLLLLVGRWVGARVVAGQSFLRFGPEPLRLRQPTFPFIAFCTAISVAPQAPSRPNVSPLRPAPSPGLHSTVR